MILCEQVFDTMAAGTYLELDVCFFSADVDGDTELFKGWLAGWGWPNATHSRRDTNDKSQVRFCFPSRGRGREELIKTMRESAQRGELKFTEALGENAEQDESS